MDGLDQAALVARGDATPTELLEAAIRRAEAVNPALNAITVPLYEQDAASRIRPAAERPLLRCALPAQGISAPRSRVCRPRAGRACSRAIPPPMTVPSLSA